MTEEKQPPTVDFRCHPEHEDAATRPEGAGKHFSSIQSSNHLTPELQQATEKDPKTHDAMTLGWYLYPPETITVQPDTETEGSFTVKLGSKYISKQEPDTEQRGPPTAIIETLWWVSIPADHVLFITGPLFEEETVVTPKLLRGSEDWEPVTIPITVTGSVTFHEKSPLAHAILLPEDLVNTDSYDVGAFHEAAATEYTRYNKLNQLYRDPYMERIRNAKPSGDLIDQRND